MSIDNADLDLLGRQRRDNGEFCRKALSLERKNDQKTMP
jgi:hypothetical protein